MGKTSKIALAAALALGSAGLSAAQTTHPGGAMARELVAAASAFETYTRTAGAIDPKFQGPSAVASAVSVGASHDPVQLEAGMIVYAALAALQSPGFVEGVQRIAADPAGRETLVRRLTESPDTALELPDADAAAGHAQAALMRQIEPLIADGRRVKQAAYDVQHRRWSKAMVTDGPARLALVKKLSARTFTPSDRDADRLVQAVTAPADGPASSPSPVIVRGLAVAALAVAGRAGEADAEAFRPLLTEARSASCVRMAKLNLFQCMAVAGPHYEDVFCLGEHAMIEPGQCLADAAGGPSRMASAAPAGGRLIALAAERPTDRDR